MKAHQMNINPTVQDIADTKKHASVTFASAAVAFSNEQACLIRAENIRGNFEILLAADTMHLKEEIIDAQIGTLEGFFRRRSSGFQSDGTRHYIWTFCPTGWVVSVAEVDEAA